MSRSPDSTKIRHAPEDLPPAMQSLWRTFVIGYRAEPKLLSASLGAVAVGAIPDVLVAVWLKMISDGVIDGDRTLVMIAALGLAASAAATWFVRVMSERIERRFRDRVGIALESHVARLHAEVATIEHSERPEYMDRLSVLRDQVFALDHLFLSLFSTLGWIVRLVLTIVLLASISPVLILLVLFAIPTVFTSTQRPAVERRVEEGVASRHAPVPPPVRRGHHGSGGEGSARQRHRTVADRAATGSRRRVVRPRRPRSLDDRARGSPSAG